MSDIKLESQAIDWLTDWLIDWMSDWFINWLIDCLIRLDDIAGDAELQEKSQADLEHLADLILTTSEQVMKEHEEKLKEQSPAEGQQRSLIIT